MGGKGEPVEFSKVQITTFNGGNMPVGEGDKHVTKRTHVLTDICFLIMLRRNCNANAALPAVKPKQKGASNARN
jgi:hypothetical protein